MCEGRELSTVKLDMNQLAGCVECKVSFQKERYQADEVVSLQLHLFSSAPSALPLKEVSIHLSRECYTCTLSPGGEGEGEGEPIPLLPYSVFSHTFTFLPHTNDVTGSIHADSIHIELGYPGSEHPIVSLTWSLPPVSWGQPCTRVPPGFSKQWSKLQQHYSTDITLRESKVDLYIQTPSPSLVNDLHRLLLILENREEGDISNVSFKLELVRSGGEESPLVTSLVLDPSVSEEMRSSLTDFSFKQDLIRSGDTCTKVVCVRSSSANIQEFHLLVSYEIARDLGKYGVINCSCVKESRSSHQHSVSVQGYSYSDISEMPPIGVLRPNRRAVPSSYRDSIHLSMVLANNWFQSKTHFFPGTVRPPGLPSTGLHHSTQRDCLRDVLSAGAQWTVS